MVRISDDKFMRASMENHDASHAFNQRKFNKEDLKGIADGPQWVLNQAEKKASKFETGDPMPKGTEVAFTAPDGTEYRGRVAARSGSDYVVEVSDGESYLIPPGKLAKAQSQVREAVQRTILADIQLVSKPAIEVAGRCHARIAFKGRRPTDTELIRWAAEVYPDFRLVDANLNSNRTVDLVFEIQAYEDTKPQGGDQNDRGMGLARESVEGTGGVPSPASQAAAPDMAADKEAISGNPELMVCLNDSFEGQQVELSDMLTSGIETGWKTQYYIFPASSAADALKMLDVVFEKHEGDRFWASREEAEVDVNSGSPTPIKEELAAIEKELDPGELEHEAAIIAKKLAAAGAWVCGGGVRDLYLGEAPSDIDIFIPNTSINQWYEHLRQAGFTQKRRKFTSNDITVDVVGTDRASPQEVVASFDCNVCRWWIDKEGNFVPLNQTVRLATDVKEATFDGKDLFQSSKRRAAKLVNRGWKVLANDGWEVIEDTDDTGSYTDVLKKKFTLTSPKKISVGGEEIDLPAGEHFITVEARYGKVDAWIDDMHQVVMPDKAIDPSNARVDPSRIEAVKSKADSIIGGQTSTNQSEKQDWVCTCGADNEKGYPCWRCNGSESGAVSFQQKRSQLGEPGDAEAFNDLTRAARWVLARFNDSNPEYYALPQETETAGEDNNRVVRLGFTLQKKDGDGFSHLFISRAGQIETTNSNGASPARGFVQVDSEGNLPMIMLYTPMGPENVQEYGFDFTASQKQADYDACMQAATDVMSQFGGYTAEAQAEFESRLVKLGVDDKSKDYWKSYFKDYGEQMTRDVSAGPLDMRKLNAKRLAATYQPAPTDHMLTDEESALGLRLAEIMTQRRAQYEAIWKGFDKRKNQDVNMGGSAVPLSELTQVAQWALQVADDDQDMHEAIYSLVYDFLRKKPGFLQSMLGTKTLNEEGVGFTLLYALRDSPRAFKKFKKHINNYQKRYQSDKWKEMEQRNREWRDEQKKPKTPGSSKPDRNAPGRAEPSGGSEELVVEPEGDNKQPEEFTALDEPEEDSWLESHRHSGKQMIIRQAAPAEGPVTHNAPGKDDKEDYDHQDSNKQPARSEMKFKVTRMFSTTSSEDNGYVIMDITWSPEIMENMSPQNVQQQVISFVKGLESKKEFHDFGVMGKVRIDNFDYELGLARVKVRCSETRGVPTMNYNVDMNDEDEVVIGVN